VAVVCDRIILSSLQHPSLNITFTLNHWAHFVAMLKDVDNAAQLIPLERKASGRGRQMQVGPWGWLKLVTFDEKRAITRKRYKIDV